MADDRKTREPGQRQTMEKVQESEYRKGYDSVGVQPPKGSDLTPQQAAGIAPASATDQSTQSNQSNQSSQNKT